TNTVLTLQMYSALFAFGLVAWKWVWPLLSGWTLSRALVPILVLHSLRTVALCFTLPDVVSAGFPREQVMAIGYGDTVSAALAMLTLVLLAFESRTAVAAAWVFNVFGTLDMMHAGVAGVRYGLNEHTAPAFWWVLTFFIPALLVTHCLVYGLL